MYNDYERCKRDLLQAAPTGLKLIAVRLTGNWCNEGKEIYSMTFPLVDMLQHSFLPYNNLSFKRVETVPILYTVKEEY